MSPTRNDNKIPIGFFPKRILVSLAGGPVLIIIMGRHTSRNRLAYPTHDMHHTWILDKLCDAA